MPGLLADTNILLWALEEPERLPDGLRRELENAVEQPVFSVVSLWEIAIKTNLGRSDFSVDVRRLRSVLLRDGWCEVAFGGEHAIVAGGLPRLHGDPFDRALVAQAEVEAMVLLTSDRRLKAYGGNVRYFRPTGASRG